MKGPRYLFRLATGRQLSSRWMQLAREHFNENSPVSESPMSKTYLSMTFTGPRLEIHHYRDGAIVSVEVREYDLTGRYRAGQ